MNDEIRLTRAKIAELGKLMYDRKLTDSAGGNISVRVGEQICITPRYAGSKYQWNLSPDQVLVCDRSGKKLAGNGEISREARVHLRLFEEFPEGKAVVHGHAQNVLVFCANHRSIPMVLEDTQKFESVDVCEFAPAHSPKLADHICNKMLDHKKALEKQAIAVVAPWHGLFVLGKDLNAAYDAFERIEGNAYIVLMSRVLPDQNNSQISLAGQTHVLRDFLADPTRA